MPGLSCRTFLSLRKRLFGCQSPQVLEVYRTYPRRNRFTEAFRQYSSHRLLAGIAAVTFHADCDRYAHKRGMFVLKPVAGIAQILNDEVFVPKEF